MRAIAVLVLIAGCLEAPPGPLPAPSGPDAADAPGGDGGQPNPACDETFGAGPDYLLCGSDDVSCTFYLNLDGDFTCDMGCAVFGTTCVDGFDDTDTEDKCEVATEIGCADAHSDEICQCALPPA